MFTHIKPVAAVGFEPTPPKRLVPKTSALDRSATLPVRNHQRPQLDPISAINENFQFQHAEVSFALAHVRSFQNKMTFPDIHGKF